MFDNWIEISGTLAKFSSELANCKAEKRRRDTETLKWELMKVDVILWLIEIKDEFFSASAFN